jgi:hypothetical protein
MRRCIDPGQAKNAQAMALPAGNPVDQFAGADKRERPLTHLAAGQGRRYPRARCTGFTRKRAATAGNETLMKQFLKGTKPFWRFRANVLKRFTCTPFPNDAPKTAQLGVEQGTTNV